MRRGKLIALLMLAASCAPRETADVRVAPSSVPVILISIDTLRADRLPAYGYTRVATPHIDAFRKDSIVFRNAYSHVPLTLPSHVSMLTGLIPPEHGVRNNIGFRYDSVAHPPITQSLNAAGYDTGAAVSAWVLRGNTGLARAFDFYDDNIAVQEGEAAGRLQRPGRETVAAAQRWIEPRKDQPFFLMLHLFEPHSPHEGGYDAEVVATDTIVGQFFAWLKTNGIYDRAIIIFTSDHGEGLGDHGEDEHGIFLYREAIHVPLMIKLSSSARGGSSVDTPVQHADLAPTIAELTGAKPPDGARGQSLFALPPANRRIYSETLYPRIHLGWSDLRSLVDDRFHFIDAPRPELYAVADERERANVVEENRRVVSAMRSELAPISREVPKLGNMDPEEAKKLAALGYLTSTPASSGPLPDPKDRIRDLRILGEATALDRAGRFDEAITKLRAVVERNPHLTDAWTLLGRSLERSGRLGEAADTYKRGLQVAPTIAGEFSLSLANVYLLMNRPDEATAHAEAGRSSNPGSAHIMMGRAALAKNDTAAALRHAQEAAASFSYDVPSQILVAQVQIKRGQLREALATIEAAIARDGDAPALLHFVHGDVLARMNRHDQAILAFHDEIRLYPQNRQAYANLAVVYMVSGLPADAHRTMERLVAANPGRSSHELAARTFAELGDSASAAVWRRKVE